MVRRGNEAAAIAFVNKINTAQAYFASRNKGRFAKGFPVLVEAKLLDKQFNTKEPVVDGYRFRLRVEDGDFNYYSVNADPAVSGGLRSIGTTHLF